MLKKNSFLLFFVLTIVFASCKKEENTPTTILDETIDTTAMLKYSGAFSSGPYGIVSGTAMIYKTGNVYDLKFTNFNSSNGPDLRVYLSKEMIPGEFIDLGALKSTAGNQVYDITGIIDFTEYKYALVHCRQFNHLFGWALLQ